MRSGRLQVLALFVIAAGWVAVCLSFIVNQERRSPSPGAPVAVPQPAGAQLTGAYYSIDKFGTAGKKEEDPAQLLKLIELPPGLILKEGLAVALAIDTSYSMRGKVADANGIQRPKLDVALRAYRSAVAKLAEFRKRNPGLPLELGVYEFNADSPRCLLPLGPLDLPAAIKALEHLTQRQGTPVGEALIEAKRDLDRSGLARRHLLLMTDGENTRGRDPAAVARANSMLPIEQQVGIHFITFQVQAAKFSRIKEAGGTVLEAIDGRELDLCMDYILERKILAEKPERPRPDAIELRAYEGDEEVEDEPRRR